MKKRVILLDKSALQSLSPEEVKTLEHHFFVNLPPVLITEILADLRKNAGHNIVRGLFSKVRALNPIVCLDWITLCSHNLLGQAFPSGRIPTDQEPTLSSNGQVDYGKEPPPKIKEIDDWSSGQISGETKESALQWKRDAENSIDLESSHKELLTQFKVSGFTQRFGSAQQVRSCLDEMLASKDTGIQRTCLDAILTRLDANESFRKKVLDRWHTEGKPPLREFAQYSYFCFRALSIFGVALRDELIGRKNTNLIDLEYFFYAPFCDWFVSDDGLHKALYRAVLDDRHVFSEGRVLKGSLQADELTRVAQFNLELPWFFF